MQQSASVEEDEEEPIWNWRGPRRETPSRKGFIYNQVEMRYMKDGRVMRRTFEVGDCVYADAGNEEFWFAQILSFYQTKVPSIDPEVHVVGNAPPKELNKWVSFRWLYKPHEVGEDFIVDDVSLGKNADNLKIRPRELFFSDHCEVKRKSNSVSVIAGRVRLVDNPDHLSMPFGDRFIESDKSRFVRFFFNNLSLPKKVRLLRPGELAYLLSNPTQSQMYANRSFTSLLPLNEDDLYDSNSDSEHDDINVNTRNRHRSFAEETIDNRTTYRQRNQRPRERATNDDHGDAASESGDSDVDDSPYVRQNRRNRRSKRHNSKRKSVFDSDSEREDKDPDVMDVDAVPSAPNVPRRRREIVEDAGQVPRSFARPNTNKASVDILRGDSINALASNANSARPRHRNEVIEASGQAPTARNMGNGPRRPMRREVIEDYGFVPGAASGSAPANNVPKPNSQLEMFRIPRKPGNKAAPRALNNDKPSFSRRTVGDELHDNEPPMMDTADDKVARLDETQSNKMLSIQDAYRKLPPNLQSIVRAHNDELIRTIVEVRATREKPRNKREQGDFAREVLKRFNNRRK